MPNSPVETKLSREPWAEVRRQAVNEHLGANGSGRGPDRLASGPAGDVCGIELRCRGQSNCIHTKQVEERYP